MMYVITRHAGAVQWLQQFINAPYVLLAHLHAINMVQAGDVIIGTLPVNLIAKINRQGARYLHLHIDTPAHLRGQELTAAQLVQLGASLVEYSVHQHG